MGQAPGMIQGLLAVMLSLAAPGDAAAATEAEARPLPAVGDYGTIPQRFLGDYKVIVSPEQDAAEWWAGAPSVTRDAAGTFWLACRMRSPEHPRGLRGYEIRLLRSEDGISFETVRTIQREETQLGGFERPALRYNHAQHRFMLYLCGPWAGGPWSIVRLDDAATPAEFDASTARVVIAPRVKQHARDEPPLEYKDPVITLAEGKYHCHVTGYIRRNERVFHFVSEDGEHWEAAGDPYKPVLPLSGWHDFFVRPASVVPVGIGYLFFYEGSSTSWHDPVYNIATGLGFSFDLHKVHDLTPEAPLAVSSTPSGRFATFRYSDWLFSGDELWVYAEVLNPNESHEIRLIRLGM